MTDKLTSRDMALAALGDRAGNVTAHLDRILPQAASPAEAHLAWELAMGTLRRRGSLDAIIAAFERRRGEPLPARVQNILRLAVYQLLFLERIPDFAAVNEAVGQAPEHLRGFVNGLLRNLLRAVSPAETGNPAPAADILPTWPGQFRRFDKAIFADPNRRPAEYLAGAYSLPEELAARWLKAFSGSLTKTLPLAMHANCRPPLIIRVDPCGTAAPGCAERSAVAAVIGQLAELGISAQPHANGTSIVVAGPLALEKLPAFQQGLAQPQDPTAGGVIEAAAEHLRPGMNVLDVCAAPGTKTMQIARRLAGQGQIVAADVSPEKLQRIEESARRCGVENVRPVLAEKLGELPEASFDFVLVDAPCSNTGVLARRPEARWRLTRRSLEELVFAQRNLAYLGANFTKPGGVLVYSTCSLERQENDALIEDLLSRRRDLKLLESRTTLPAGADDPTHWRDGGYLAILRKKT